MHCLTPSEFGPQNEPLPQFTLSSHSLGLNTGASVDTETYRNNVNRCEYCSH